MFKAFVFLFILGLFNSSFDYVASNSMMTVNSYLKWLWKELVVPNLSCYLRIYVAWLMKITDNLWMSSLWAGI